MSSSADLTIPTCESSWSSIAIIVITGLNMLISLGKQILNNKKQAELKTVLSRLDVSVKPIETEQLELNIPEHLKASVTKEI